MPQSPATTLLLAFLTALALSHSPGTGADTPPPPSEADVEDQADDEELARLLAVVDKYTEIATRTRMNADFVPGMVTVLEGDELAARGRQDVWEALADVPGILPYVEGSGARNLAIRGNGTNVFTSGKVKVLVNGIAQNSSYQGQVRPVWELPIAQVERIEVIRGPGSAVHGEYAYDGVVNIITRTDGHRVFLRAGEDDNYSGGATLAWSDPEEDLRLSLNLAARGIDVGDVVSGPNIGSIDGDGPGPNPPFAFPNLNAPGPVNDMREARSAILAMGYRDFSLDIQYIDNGFGDQFGVNNQLPPPDDRTVFENTNTAIEARQQWALNESLDATLRLGWFRYEFETDSAVALVDPASTDPLLLVTADYEEQKHYAGLLLEGRAGQRHEWLLDLQYDEVEVKRAVGVTNRPLLVPDTDSFVDPDRDRRHLSVAVQDQIRATDEVTVTVGLRYDDYNDAGDALSPRLAAVWRLSDRHVFKGQYAEAFRPPTFLELYTEPNFGTQGNPGLGPTESAIYELGYVFKGIGRTARATLFHSELKDLIRVESVQYENVGDARIRGAELEYEQVLSKRLSIDGNLSLTDTEDRDTGRDLPGAADWLANVGVRYRPTSGVAVDARYRYVGERAREVGDTRPPIDDYQTVDLTVGIADHLSPGLILRAGVRNLFDEGVAYPALIDPAIGIPNYPQDYPQRERQWWLEASYEF